MDIILSVKYALLHWQFWFRSKARRSARYLKIGKACRDYGTFFLLDAAQTVGQLVVDVQRIKCDALCATGRKFLRGPRGTGILYVRQSVMKSFLEEPSMIDHFGAPWVSHFSCCCA